VLNTFRTLCGVNSILISLYFNWMTHRKYDSYKANVQGSLVLGIGLIGQADASLTKGDLKTATVF
jgi:hypothetical protein